MVRTRCSEAGEMFQTGPDVRLPVLLPLMNEAGSHRRLNCHSKEAKNDAY